MPPLPPLKDVLEVLEYLSLPAAGGAALVMCVFLLTGRWAGALGSAVAAVAGFAWANYAYRHMGWSDVPLLPWKPPAEGAKALDWLPRSALVLLVVGLVSRWAGLAAARYLPERRWWVANVLVWIPRVAVVAVVVQRLVPEKAAAETVWLIPALGAAMLLNWVALDGVARSVGIGDVETDGGVPHPTWQAPQPTTTSTGWQVAGYQAAIFASASALMLYHHWASASYIAIVLAAMMCGVATAAGVGKADASGAVPAGVAFLPTLLLVAHLSQDSKIPQAAFWLVALAPLMLLPFLVPAVARTDRWYVRLIRAAMVLIPLVTAILLAAQHEELAFDKNEEW